MCKKGSSDVTVCPLCLKLFKLRKGQQRIEIKESSSEILFPVCDVCKQKIIADNFGTKIGVYRYDNIEGKEII